MEPSAAGQLAALNQSYKEMEHIYHWYARRHGLSDAHLWLLYSLYESQAHTQREISSIWHYPPQTVNSALKGLERQGLVLLEEVPGNKRNKRVALSERGGGAGPGDHPAAHLCRAAGHPGPWDGGDRRPGGAD